MADHGGNAEQLHEYWVHGEGAAKIRWGEPGDFQRCVDHLGKYIADPKGYCNLAHHAALGMYPATHAKMEGGGNRFNPNHAPPGAGGGQFVSASGGGGGGGGAGKQQQAKARQSAAKRQLLQRAQADREKAKRLEDEIKTLEDQQHQQHKQAAASKAQAAKAHAASHISTKGRKTAAQKAAAKTAKAHTQQASSVARRIAGLRAQVKSLLTHARLLEAQAKNMRGYETAEARNAEGSAVMAQADYRAQAKAPYGDVPYGDPGYLDADGNQASKSGKPGVKRYPLSPDKVMAAWSYINQKDNAGQYTPEQLSAIKGRIKSAMKQHGHMVSDGSGRASPSLALAETERRFTPGAIEIRSADSDGGFRIGGYGAVFDKLSRNLGGFVERVAPSAFNQTRHLGWPNVVCRYNHDPNMVLGTTAGGTLALRTDNIGLDYDVLPPQARGDIIELVERRDVQFSSFAFRVPPGGDEWAVTDQNYPMRTLLEVQLVDVAPVLDPAYPDATAGLRSLAAAMSAPLEEVVSMAAADELRRFFVRTDRPSYAPPKPKVTAAAAMMQLMEKRRDPWADQG